VQVEKVLLWDRKTEGGFPETKVLKQRVRDRIDPKKDLGHSDVGGKKKDAVKPEEASGKGVAEVKVDAPKIDDVKVDGNVERNAKEMVKDLEIDEAGGEDVKRNPDGTVCEDCR
jgi:predicted Rdx family selenoprotein